MGHNKAGERRRKRIKRAKKEIDRLRMTLGMTERLPPLGNPAVKELRRVLGKSLFEKVKYAMEKWR